MSQDARTETNHRKRGHGVLMIACCIPMLVVAVVLVAAGIVRPAFLVTAIACTAMMALMMRLMPGHDGTGSDDHT
jgi:hypothetical protein